MTDILSKKLESKIDNKIDSKRKRRQLDDGFKKGKVMNEVLDKPTVMTLYKMITDHIIAYVNGSVSAGKESVLFWGVDERCFCCFKNLFGKYFKFQKACTLHFRRS